MATETSAVIQNENLHIPRGKGIEGLKADLPKTEKKERRERKPLADLSKCKKPIGPTAPKDSTLKQKSSLRGSEATKNKKNPKSSILTDEEIKKCQEWAKEGIEKVYFTGNDLQKHERDVIEKRVKKKVDKVMSCMSKWNQVVYDYVSPMKKVAVDIGDIKRLEPEPEVLLPVASLSPTSGFDEGQYLTLDEEEILWPSYGHTFELKLKEDYEAYAPF